MYKFALFKKSSKFYWSENKIIYAILFFSCGIMLFKQKALNIEENSLDKFFIGLTLFVFFCGLISKFIGLTKVEHLRGNLEGYLTFENDFININEEIYLLEKINSIQISNDDYIGKLVHTSSGNLGPALSNGTNNFIIIFLKSGETKKYQFELINSNDFQNVRTILIQYHLKRKIDFWELANVLGEKSSSEIRDLKIEIEKICTITNS